ncbi:MAG: MFS transporter [Acidobacteria bacterium]|nr:MFS transporter [Acidobacteriota bacterium]
MTSSNGTPPSSASLRWWVLAFASILTFGSYFAYDSISAISTTLLGAYNVQREQLGLLYSMYSIAAILTVFLGGMLIDRIGTRRASLLFSITVMVGAAIVAFAPNIYVAYVGRFVFGAGSESLVVAQNAILSRWFRGKELALAFGISLTISRLGTLFTYNTEALIATRYGYLAALWVAAALCGVSVLANLVYNMIDLRGEKSLGLQEAGGGDKIVFSDVRRFRASYWYVVALCVTFYSAIFPFQSLAPDFFHDKWGLPSTTAPEGSGFFYAAVYDFFNMGRTAPGTTQIIIFASMCLAPFAGRLVDRFGRRASLMIVGSLLLTVAHATMGLTQLVPWVPMIVLGAGFVLVPAAMWPSVPLLVEKERVGTAFGLMTMIQNIGLALFPWLNGRLRDTTQTYTASMLMFAGLGVCGLVFALLLRRADARERHVLELPSGRAS